MGKGTRKSDAPQRATFRPATRADFVSFYGRDLPMTVKAWVAVNGDDKPLGIGGYYLDENGAVAFTDNRKEMTKRDRVRAGRFLVDRLKELGFEVAAGPGPEGDTALRHFGFEPYGTAYRLT